MGNTYVEALMEKMNISRVCTMSVRPDIHLHLSKYFWQKSKNLYLDLSVMDADIELYLKGKNVLDLDQGWCIVHCIEYLKWAQYFGEDDDAGSTGKLETEILDLCPNSNRLFKKQRIQSYCKKDTHLNNDSETIEIEGTWWEALRSLLFFCRR